MRVFNRISALVGARKVLSTTSTYQLRVFCHYSDMTTLRMQVARQLYDRGLKVDRIAISKINQQVYCLSVLFTCIDQYNETANALVAHFSQIQQVKRVHWTKHVQQRTPNRILSLIQQASAQH